MLYSVIKLPRYFFTSHYTDKKLERQKRTRRPGGRMRKLRYLFKERGQQRKCGKDREIKALDRSRIRSNVRQKQRKRLTVSFT